ncbi:bifunctional aminoglycoside phosphotransferase/ATP-binding protein [Paracoccus benzoatiresistens]|uniref:AAA family ATPase n=1 Tax=Paracoccus benzoatiresistens TaxID=2997341 RepID=A0ABT4JAA3_9RHOB|nr:AAA family ATPase [Paracoccus sp. EF6]MCZ0964065.1 AAA family ATPase [Paracoccus sp. EF6]
MTESIPSQAEVVAYLASPAAFGGETPVKHVETHGAHVFLAGNTALKIKRAVRYDYMDMSTLELREASLRRELELNAPAAPEIYGDILPITRSADGRLALGAEGEPVEWVLRMHRFRAEDELLTVATRGELTDAIAADLGRQIAAYHKAAPVRDLPGDQLIGNILAELHRVFAELTNDLPHAATGPVLGTMTAQLALLAPLLRKRSATRHVRRAHGDLHLRNIVLIGGRPVLYDALEFDETLGTCDLLYDVAFLFMDLCHRGLRRQATVTLMTWLTELEGSEDTGLAALPLFLAVRALIRAMVLVQTDRAAGTPGLSHGEAMDYINEAQQFLNPPAPVLVALGGVSGTGKSVLARSLAPRLGAAPGAVILSSDIERKARGTIPDYASSSRTAIYQRLFERARAVLGAGHTVLLDATFLEPQCRAEAKALAQEMAVSFCPLWLTASEPILVARVGARRGDASDADAAVVRAQLARAPDAADWTHLDSSGSPEMTLEAALSIIGSHLAG